MKQKVIIIAIFCIALLLSGCQRPVASDTHFRLLETESLSDPVLEWAQSLGEDVVVSLARKPLSSSEEIYYVYMNRTKISGMSIDVSDGDTLRIETTPLKANEVPEEINEDYFHIFQATIKPVEYVSIDGVEMEASSLVVIVTEQQKVQTESSSVSTVGGADGPQDVQLNLKIFNPTGEV
ncbi:hypothetical protein [Dethiobacter alkaliphilus]|uniref:Lipoprotein n=1 Tax=Dethiobacter alkaliphilus AHT 1 TaxID=555088 RepID=C0GI24_DETAL|nr:hypothetical protein [Dethiobacter alkaliphilus]EEG77098.1 hypothetical protein DealDRAFT_2133 [Dethiobacter alkaliphilus AHT 1]